VLAKKRDCSWDFGTETVISQSWALPRSGYRGHGQDQRGSTAQTTRAASRAALKHHPCKHPAAKELKQAAIIITK